MTDSADLAALCARLAEEEYVTVDTEFLRERTYWAQLCLIQIAGKDEAVAIDPLAPGIDLQPLFDLLAAPKPLKVFHAARQDLEIFVQLMGKVPAPLFDTQVAAMVCGFGEQASYETLAAKLAKAKIDKAHRFTDWSARPLSSAQVSYALGDVTYLRTIYEKLVKMLAKSGRSEWLDGDMAVLSDPATYRSDPENAWIRLKPRSGGARFLNVLQSIAAWRETEAQNRNMPRNRLLKDEALTEIAAQVPTSVAELARSRMVGRGVAEGSLGPAILDAVARGLARKDSEAPTLPEKPEMPQGQAPLLELLKVLLKHCCEQHDVAQKLVATSADLEAVAISDEADVLALKGWRYEIFGRDALALKNGKLWLGAANGKVRHVYLEG